MNLILFIMENRLSLFNLPFLSTGAFDLRDFPSHDGYYICDIYNIYYTDLYKKDIPNTTYYTHYDNKDTHKPYIWLFKKNNLWYNDQTLISNISPIQIDENLYELYTELYISNNTQKIKSIFLEINARNYYTLRYHINKYGKSICNCCGHDIAIDGYIDNNSSLFNIIQQFALVLINNNVSALTSINIKDLNIMYIFNRYSHNDTGISLFIIKENCLFKLKYNELNKSLKIYDHIRNEI